MFEASSIMNSAPAVLKPQTPLSEAIEMISDSRYRALPVVDDDGVFLGIISEERLLTMIEDIDESEYRAGEFIQPVAACFYPDDNLIDICQYILEKGVALVPIVSNAHKLLGVITPKELLDYNTRYQQFFAQFSESPEWLQLTG